MRSIIVRGYDKFFDLGEVPWTQVHVRSSLVHLVTTTDVRRLTSGRHRKHAARRYIEAFIRFSFHNDSEKSRAVVGRGG